MLNVLIVEDDADIRPMIAATLRAAGHVVTEAADGEQAIQRLRASVFDVLLSDLRLPKVDGLAVAVEARAQSPQIEIMLMTSFATVADAVAAMKSGVTDYLTKPFSPEELLLRMDAVSSRVLLRRELADARAKLAQSGFASKLVGGSPSIARALERTATVSASDAPVLITGESGTGKELVARMIHDGSARRDGPFVAINCASFPETLLEAELFGYERGAFTGAVKRRDGRFRAASGGTLLLDELAEMPLPAQAKLLRVLQEGKIEPLGTNDPIAVDVRVVSATNRDLKKRIAEGLFRQDLYFRLNVIGIHLPALRDRPGDLPLLSQHFLKSLLPAGARVPDISLRAWSALMNYPFPGNVRELAHAIQHAVVLSHGGDIDLEHLPEDVIGTASAKTAERAVGPLSEAMKRFEREYLLRALAQSGGARVRAATALGITRKTLWEKLRGHGISDSDIED